MWDDEYTETRLQEAMTTLRSQSARGCFPAKHRSNMPDPLQSYWEVWNGLEYWEQQERLKEFNRSRAHSTPASISEMDEIIFGLMECFLDPVNRIILTARNTIKPNGDQTSWRKVEESVNHRWTHTWIKESIYPAALEKFSSHMAKKTLQNTPENDTKSVMM